MSQKIINHFKKADPILYKVLLLVHKEHGDKLFELKVFPKWLDDLKSNIEVNIIIEDSIPLDSIK